MTRSIPVRQMIVLMLAPLLLACQGISHDYPADIAGEIPLLDGIVVDGEAGDWPADYAPLRVYSDVRGKIPVSSDFSVGFRLGWDQRGLLFMAEIRDDIGAIRIGLCRLSVGITKSKRVSLSSSRRTLNNGNRTDHVHFQRGVVGRTLGALQVVGIGIVDITYIGRIGRHGPGNQRRQQNTAGGARCTGQRHRIVE